EHNYECGAASMPEPTARLGRIAILWRGDEAARRSATPETSRFKAVFAALADVGVDANPGEAMINKFNNTLEGTDCENAGLPAHSCDIAKPKTVLRVIPKTPHIIPKTPHNALRARCDRIRQTDRKNGVVV